MSNLPESQRLMPTFTRAIVLPHIWLHFKLGEKPSEIYETLKHVYARYYPSISTVKYWYKKFSAGRLSFEDEPCTRRTSDDLTALKDGTIEQLVKEDPFVTQEMIAQEVHSRMDMIRNVLHDHWHCY
ncbi:hypothetical protein IWQ62_002477 [Dispira parvispora]|uniref:Mos1 transposase HTH domain-containing protein n=1 Tax=Dispira parvispora TaxID=1520584 RepID=A0A9W8AR78_9FUNG|nr:hypothetical protein IWQ62_002477 [Dispira parvispora]